MQKQNIIVVGAGVGGLTLARVAQRHGCTVTVYEREAARAARAQGGVLDLHPESGQWALAAAGLEPELRALARAEGQDLRIVDPQGHVHWNEVSPPDLMQRPEVDRPRLRDLLIDSLAPDTIQWGQGLDTIAPHGDGYRLHFAGGATVDAAVVIGADGARSRVRPLLTDARPSYTGVSFIEVGIPAPSTAVSETVGRGSLFALGDNKGMIAQRCGDGRIRIYVAFRIPDGGFDELGIAFADPAQARAAIAAQFAGWEPSLLDLIAASDDTILPRPIYAMPVGVHWPSQPAVTILGDAAHLMSPFAGAGANLAMQDGAELAQLLAEHEAAQAIATYESRMLPRAEAAARDSADGLEECISHDGAARLAQTMRRHHEE
jgi:2-polyprenyl-6-methoxyphenol hydroxylase-like FAD-dependent oxidoreductase